MNKTILLLRSMVFAVIASYSVAAPVWYGSGDDNSLVGRWSCEGKFNDSSGQGNNKEAV